ncbi:MAG: hypothetical protein FWG10_14035 [Eubacteriaceae bacterium]|nr:hypothetical protein [Eubacteriaceae bacterium]
MKGLRFGMLVAEVEEVYRLVPQWNKATNSEKVYSTSYYGFGKEGSLYLYFVSDILVSVEFAFHTSEFDKEPMDEDQAYGWIMEQTAPFVVEYGEPELIDDGRLVGIRWAAPTSRFCYDRWEKKISIVASDETAFMYSYE